MNLKDILLLFDDEIVDQMESIGYLNSANDFEITAHFVDEVDADTQQDIGIWLFSNGETALHVIKKDMVGYILDNAIDFYIKVRDIWKNNV